MPSTLLTLGLFGLLGLLACGDKGTSAAPDADGDGFDASLDCNDADPTVHPEATEVCNGIDDDCNDRIDDADPALDTSTASTWYNDADFDGYGAAADSTLACTLPEGHVADDTDCDDGDASVNPSAHEICNGVDDDCNDQVDDGTSSGTWFTDADGDGYGDASVTACTQPADTVTVGGDCDDGDAAVNPDATELCDGIDNNCDGSLDDPGTAAFEDSSGVLTDMSASLSGTDASPVSLNLTTPGTLWLCDGTWYANLAVATSVDIRGRSGDASAVVLDGAGTGSVVRVTTSRNTVGLYDLTLAHGRGQGSAYGTQAGGGLLCEVSSALTVANVVIESNTGGYGAGLHVFGCSLDMSDSIVRNNSATQLGGGMSIVQTTAVLDGVEVTGNSSTSDIGGIYLSANTSPASLDATDLVVDNNIDFYSAGGLYAYNSDLVVRSSTPGASAITNNTTTYGGGGLWLYPASSTVETSFTDVDFGTVAGRDDNSQPEIMHGYHYFPYSAGDGASFSCGLTGCGSPTAYTLGSSASSVSLSSGVYGSIYKATSAGTLEAAQVYVGYGGTCVLDLYVFSSPTAPSLSGTTSSWDLEWSQTDIPVAATGFYGPSAMGVLVSADSWYSLVAGLRCSSGSDSLAYASASGASTGFGTHVGYLSGTTSYTGAYTGPTSFIAYEASIAFYQLLTVTQL